jgi:hypothetical protein
MFKTLFYSAQTGTGAHPTFHVMSTGSHFLRSQDDQGLKLNTYLELEYDKENEGGYIHKPIRHRGAVLN